MSKIRTAVVITADPEQHKTTVRRVGEKTLVSCAWGTSKWALAGAYRDAAAYFLDLAGQIPGQPESLKDQVAIMQAEHKSIFCGEG